LHIIFKASATNMAVHGSYTGRCGRCGRCVVYRDRDDS